MNNKIPYDLGSLSFSLGCLPLLLLAKLPTTQSHYYCLVILLMLIVSGIYIKKRFLKMSVSIIGFLLIGFLWATHSASQYLKSIENYIDQQITVKGIVKSINVQSINGQSVNGQSINSYRNKTDNKKNYHYIDFDIREINQLPLDNPFTISLLWKNTKPPFAGETWQLSIKTKVIHSYLNEGSFDSQRFAMANSALLTGTIEEAHLVENDISFRQKIVNVILPYLNLFEHGDIMLALTFGERSTLTQEHKTLLFQTGIAHLMAISGMHILLVAYLGRYLIRGLQFLLPITWIHYWHPHLFGLGMAIFYAWLSGFNPPAMRAVWALSLWLFFRYRNRRLTSWQMINRIIALLLLFDPLMILSESFWLSCYAVVCLIFIAQWFPITKVGRNRWHIFQLFFLKLFYLQTLLTLLLLPIQLIIFNGMSGFSIIANLLAIPVISFITFPCVLIMALMSLLNGFHLTIWFGFIAEQSLSWLFTLLKPLSSSWFNIPYAYYLLSVIGWLILIVLRTALWRRYYLTLFIVFSIMLTPLLKENKVKWQIDMLDVGHGLAVVIRQGKSAILYDTGAKWQTSSAAERIIIPFLRWHNLSLDGIIISHEHNDHIGGLTILQEYYPDAWLMSSSTRLNNDYLCVSGNDLNWKSLKMTTLWPDHMHSVAENPQSCVVRISDHQFSILLTGDLERQQEEQLVLKQGKSLSSTILQIPHHGSNTSSSYTFLSHVNPNISLASVSRYNPWRLPSDKVLARYRTLNLDYYLTRSAGQISIFFYSDNNNRVIKTLRNEIKPRWYHDWFGALPNYG